MQIKQEQRQESDATVKKVEDDRALATQVKIHSPQKMRTSKIAYSDTELNWIEIRS